MTLNDLEQRISPYFGFLIRHLYWPFTWSKITLHYILLETIYSGPGKNIARTIMAT